MDRNAFHKLLAFGIERGVSDIHYEVGYPPHYRLHGELLGAIKVPPLTAQDTEAIARMILEDRSVTVDFARRFAEIDVSYSLATRGRFRASIFRQRGAVGIVMRLIPIQVLSLEQLNLPPVLSEIADARRGLVLITGATGNGKTTSMAAMIRYINETRHAHIVTIEDPIEFIHEPQKCMIIQREVGADTESFSDALTAAMRQDPDVIMVGEIRDRETAATVPEGGGDRAPRDERDPHAGRGRDDPALRRPVRGRRAGRDPRSPRRLPAGDRVAAPAREPATAGGGCRPSRSCVSRGRSASASASGRLQDIPELITQGSRPVLDAAVRPAPDRSGERRARLDGDGDLRELEPGRVRARPQGRVG